MGIQNEVMLASCDSVPNGMYTGLQSQLLIVGSLFVVGQRTVGMWWECCSWYTRDTTVIFGRTLTCAGIERVVG